MLGSKELSSVLALGERTRWRLGCCFAKLSSSLRSLPLLFPSHPPSLASRAALWGGQSWEPGWPHRRLCPCWWGAVTWGLSPAGRAGAGDRLQQQPWHGWGWARSRVWPGSSWEKPQTGLEAGLDLDPAAVCVQGLLKRKDLRPGWRQATRSEGLT